MQDAGYLITSLLDFQKSFQNPLQLLIHELPMPAIKNECYTLACRLNVFACQPFATRSALQNSGSGG